eukprot:CAMPEP_0174707022 /NCGR_PEP_ID=MMETSP1094-20130205/9660_1 /TAXON_ID=156173 /ORGANISM="Chrysochromulina brevifilum, Strain UTEX LB 985" /LENGTH=267 /DNA_ID=CAMNT_0015905357 /DNA_START=637 /DNA_END=1441 /DNA_ORIENTATION=-
MPPLGKETPWLHATAPYNSKSYLASGLQCCEMESQPSVMLRECTACRLDLSSFKRGRMFFVCHGRRECLDQVLHRCDAIAERHHKLRMEAQIHERRELPFSCCCQLGITDAVGTTNCNRNPFNHLVAIKRVIKICLLLCKIAQSNSQHHQLQGGKHVEQGVWNEAQVLGCVHPPDSFLNESHCLLNLDLFTAAASRTALSASSSSSLARISSSSSLSHAWSSLASGATGQSAHCDMGGGSGCSGGSLSVVGLGIGWGVLSRDAPLLR